MDGPFFNVHLITYISGHLPDGRLGPELTELRGDGSKEGNDHTGVC